MSHEPLFHLVLHTGLVSKELEKQFASMKKTITTTMKKSSKSMMIVLLRVLIVKYVCMF